MILYNDCHDKFKNIVDSKMIQKNDVFKISLSFDT